VAQCLLDTHPAAASLPDSAGYLPLHWAVNNDSVDMSVIKSLLQKCPSAASTPSSKNKTLPLHWCVNRSEPNLALVKELITSYPEAISTPCDHGWLPLHYCVNRAKVSLTILRLLLDRHPAGASHRNSDGQMPLHRLLDRYEPNRKAVKWLIEAEPATLKACDSEGYLPLHVALDGSKPPSWRLIKLLLQHAPQTVQITTLDGFLPLHIAMKMQDRFGNPTPPSVASSGNNQLDDDKDHASGDGQSALEREAALKLNQNRYLSIVQELVTLYPEAVHLSAVDIIPVKEGADPDTWEGQWRKSRWTPYSRALAKGKQTPIAKLLRPYKKKTGGGGDGGSSKDLLDSKKGLGRPVDMIMTPNRASGGLPGGGSGSSSKFESSSPAVTPFGNHRTPVEVQLQNKLHSPSMSNVSNNSLDNDGVSTAVPALLSPAGSNDVHSANYGNMSDVATHLPPLNASPRGTITPTTTTIPSLLGGSSRPDDGAKASPRGTPRRSPRYNPGDNGMGSAPPLTMGQGSYTTSSQKTVESSPNADLFGSLNSLAHPQQQQERREQKDSFWAEKTIDDVAESPTEFIIDNGKVNTMSWKWQW
jgi:ankyrin repeat protein